MPTKDQRRQKKLSRKAAKRKAVHKELARQKQGGLAAEFARIANAPVLDCLVCETVWDEGIGNVLLSRELRNGQVAYAVFLVDVYCLGVKDVIADIRSKMSYREDLLQRLLDRNEFDEVSASYVRKLVESSVAYAHSFGLPPHRDYRIGKELFGNIDPADCDEEFEFGKDGKPFFISGPFDTPERCNRIMGNLREHCGDDNFHFTMGMPELQFISSDDGYLEDERDDFDENDENTVIEHVV